MEVITNLINEFGPWAIIVVALMWLAKFASDQLAIAREDRNAEAERHKQEIDELTSVISNNTTAIVELTTLIKEDKEASNNG